jgi:sortase B
MFIIERKPVIMSIALSVSIGLSSCSTPPPAINDYDHPKAPTLSESIEEYYEINPDAVGWLKIEGTDINNIVLLNPNETNGNEYYLNHNIYKEPDKDGVFCIDRKWSLVDGLPRNTTVFGHSWSDDKDGPIMQQSKRYLDSQFAEAHPYINFSLSDADMLWEVFAVSYTTVDLPYIHPNLPWKDWEKVVNVIRDSSIYDYDCDITKDDKILTITTCVYSVPGNENLPLAVNDYRYIIMAKLVEPAAELEEVAVFTPNHNILRPDDQPQITV